MKSLDIWRWLCKTWKRLWKTVKNSKNCLPFLNVNLINVGRGCEFSRENFWTVGNICAILENGCAKLRKTKTIVYSLSNLNSMTGWGRRQVAPPQVCKIDILLYRTVHNVFKIMYRLKLNNSNLIWSIWTMICNWNILEKY